MADENDVEAEMMRMMQEETGGDEGGEDDDAAMGEEAGDGADAGDAGDAGDGNIDEMLEAEMLKAMSDPGDDAADAGDAAMGAGTAGLMNFGGNLLADSPEGIERISDVDVFVTVEIGGTQIPIKDIMEWTKESIVELEPEEHDPVEVMVNGKLFAQGEVVVVGDTFGVRIVQLIDPHEEPSFDNL